MSFRSPAIIQKITISDLLPRPLTRFANSAVHEPRFTDDSEVVKRVFTIPDLTLENGTVLRQVQIGYEAYGQLNEQCDNAILICHYFTGTSHCAGRYLKSDPEPGYWNAVIGPGKAIDTDRFFVMSTDVLCNINAKNPRVVTTGPASLNPDTGEPYGADFPILTIGDFVTAQKALADALNITQFHAVGGPSLGAFQAMEWAARFPEMVSRVICAIPGGLETEPFLISTLDAWRAPILIDPNFHSGNYLKMGTDPTEGLVHSLKIMTLNALHYDWAQRLFSRRWSDSTKDPKTNFENKYSVESALENVARPAANNIDANSVLRMIKAIQLFSVTNRKDNIRARFLFLPAKSDLLLFPRYAHRAIEDLRLLGLDVQVFEIEGNGGHLDGVNLISQAGPAIEGFLNSP
jgi:homoserine O-acetyltransferase